MKNITNIREALLAALESKSQLYGDSTELNQTQLDNVSHAIDEVNETVNPNLPQRPTS